MALVRKELQWSGLTRVGGRFPEEVEVVVCWRRAVNVGGVLLPRWGCRSPTASSVLSDSLWLGRQRRRWLFALYFASAPPTWSSGGPWCPVLDRPAAPLAQDACSATCWGASISFTRPALSRLTLLTHWYITIKKRGHILWNYVWGMGTDPASASCLRKCCKEKSSPFSFPTTRVSTYWLCGWSA